MPDILFRHTRSTNAQLVCLFVLEQDNRHVMGGPPWNLLDRNRVRTRKWLINFWKLGLSLELGLRLSWVLLAGISMWHDVGMCCTECSLVTITACTVVQVVVKAIAKVMGKAKFWPPGAAKPLNGFRWNNEYITMSWVCPHMKIHVALRKLGWSGRTREKNTCCGFLIFNFFCFILRLAPSPHKWTDFDDLYVLRHTTCFCPRMCLLRSRSYCFPFLG